MNSAEDSPLAFEKHVLTDQYYCDGINGDDINRDSWKDIIVRNYKYEIFTYPDVEDEPEKQDTIETKFKRKRKATYKKTYEKSKKARELESIGK